MAYKGHDTDKKAITGRDHAGSLDSFVLDKGIFSNIFEKDIRRVYIYKKAERLAKAIHLIAPAFHSSPALRNRLDMIAVGLVDAATLPPLTARDALSRELLALSSVLSIARTGALLSPMNADLIAHEAHQLLEEIASYEEPRLFLDEAPSLAALARGAGERAAVAAPRTAVRPRAEMASAVSDTKGQVSDNPVLSSRREAIIQVLRSKGPSYIKDVSTMVRDVSEKTIQRELAALVEEGLVTRSGERRWTTYALSA